MKSQFLTKETTGVWVMDVQGHLCANMDRSYEVIERICFFLNAVRHFKLPMIVAEQYPKGLGETIAVVKKLLPDDQIIFSKTAFSGYYEPIIKEAVEKTGIKQWILLGFEAHICILQTAKDLINAGHCVTVLNDAISSRSLFDFSTAIGELRDCGARISSAETILYELMRDAKTPEFKEVLPLVKKVFTNSHV